MFWATRPSARLLVCLLCAVAPWRVVLAQLDIPTERYDDARLGANLLETQLDTSSVNVNGFGKVWSYTVSGSVYAQALYVRDVTIPGQGTHNVLYVVTMNDIVYAFDADSSTDTPLLSFDITSEVPGSTPVPILDIIPFNDNIIGNVGIESTPHIDLANNTMYLVARTREMDGTCGTPNPTFCQRLHALDITTFAEKAGSPVILGGNVACNPSGGGGACGLEGPGILTFDPKIEDQRASIAYANGRVFIAWSGHSDQAQYHGWVMAYDATTLQQTMIFSSAPDGAPFDGGGIWMAGRAPAVDAAGSVYYLTGNGKWDGVTNFGESFLKFGPTPDTPLLDWFTPSVYDFLNQVDLDLSGSGPILLPGTDLIIGAGKSGVFYMTHTANMGHESADDTNIVQVFDNSLHEGDNDQIKGGPVYWNRNGGLGPWMYVWSDQCNHFNAYHFNGSTFDLPPVSQSTLLSPCGSSGGVLTLSANGSTPGSGIVWSSMPTNSDGNSGVHNGTLRAFDADNLNTELWNSNQNDARDDAGNWPKFSAPTVVNGRVYLASFPEDGVSDAVVNVYGLLDVPPNFTMTAGPGNPGIVPGGSATYTINLSGQNGFSDAVHLDVAGLPPNATASFAENDLTPPAQTTLTIQTDAGIPLGQYTFSVTATSGSLEHDFAEGLYVTDAPAGQGAISVDFVGSGQRLQPIESAGVLVKPNWNFVSGTSGTGSELFDESAGDTGATLDWTTDGVGVLGIGASTPDLSMMNEFFDATANSTTITVASLPPEAGGYFVYVYADGNNGNNDRSGVYEIEGSDGFSTSITITDAANATFNGTFVQALTGPGNYAVFLVGGTGFTLTATPGPGGHAPLNGIQIVRGGDRIFANGFD
jgi:hypothetical protein